MSKISNNGRKASATPGSPLGAYTYTGIAIPKWSSEQFREVAPVAQAADGYTATYLIVGGENESAVGTVPTIRNAIFDKAEVVDGVSLIKRNASIRVRVPSVINDADGNLLVRPKMDEFVFACTVYDQTNPSVLQLRALALLISDLLDTNIFDDERDASLFTSLTLGIPGLVGVGQPYTGTEVSA
jgi:hypothetical protein